MEIPGAEKRRQELEEIEQAYPYSYPIVAGTGLVGIGVVIGYLLFADHDGYLTNIFTEILSVSFTILVLNVLGERRERERLKQDLIYRMGSTVNHEAVRAIEELRRYGWLTDGSVKKTNLMAANLEGAYLEFANLQKTYLMGANLQQAVLGHTNLQGANLIGANLQQAELGHTNLQGANLMGADLQQAKLGHTNLQGANLMGADLQQAELEHTNLQEAIMVGANLQGTKLTDTNLQSAILRYIHLQDIHMLIIHRSRAILQRASFLHKVQIKDELELKDSVFDANSTLPDGMYWTPDTDMTRFTDPKHDDFWRSDKPYSPAYWGDEPDGE